MIKTLRLLLTAWLSFLPLVAQNTPDMTRIHGVVMDSITQQAVPFATVQLVNSVNQQRYGQITDDRGTFIVSVPQSSDYQLSVRSIGYQPHERTVRAKTNATIDLGEVLLHQSSTQLDGVTVSAAKSLVEVNLDRIGYRVKDDPIAQTSTLLEMLSSVPLVTVDGDDNVQVKGSSNFKIYMNGKPSTLISNNPKEVLASIPAKSIQKVEVITDPGVKYDAEGVTAILNIVTSSSSLEGFTASINTRASSNGSISVGPYISAKKGKIGLTVNYNYRHLFPNSVPSFARRTSGSIVAVDEGTALKSHDINYGNALLSYELDKSRLINVSVGTMIYSGLHNNKTTNSEWRDEALNKVTNIRRITLMQQGSWNAGIDYQKIFNQPQQILTASYQFVNTPNNQDLDIMQDEVLTKMGAKNHTEQKSRLRSGMNEHTAQVDYTMPINQQHSIESGLKYIARRSSSHPTHQKLLSGHQEWQPGSLFNTSLGVDRFSHQQDVFGAYASYSYHQGGWTVKTGGRLESDWVNVFYPNSSEANMHHRSFNAVPQLSVGYNLNPTTQLKFNYKLHIARPSIRQLNPFKQQMTEYNVFYGNPNLNSVKLHMLSLSFNRYSRMFTLNSSVGYQTTKNAILSYSELDAHDPKLVLTTFGNIGQVKSWTFNAYAMYVPFSWLRTNVNANLSLNHEQSDRLKLSKHYARFNISAGMQFIIPKGWTARIRGGYYDGGGSLQSRYSSDYYLSMGVNKSFFKKRLTIGVMLREPFRAYQTSTSMTQGQGFTLYVENSRPARAVGLRISYRFGQMKAKVRRVQHRITNDDLQTESKKAIVGSD